MNILGARVGRLSLIVTLALPALAMAADSDGDSYDDSIDVCPNTVDEQTDTDGDGWGDACVHPTATVHADAVLGVDAYVGASSMVGRGAYIGDYATVGVGSTVGARAIVMDAPISDTGVVVGSDSVIHRGATLHPGSNTSGSVIGRSATVGEGASVANAFVGYGAFVGENAQVLDNAVVGNLARVEDEATLGFASVLARSSVLGLRAEIGSDVVVGPNTTIGEDAVLGNDIRIRKNSEIGARTTLSDNVKIGRDSEIGEDVTIGAGASLPGCFIGDGAVIEADAQSCEPDEGGGTGEIAWGDELRISHADGSVPGNVQAGSSVLLDDGSIVSTWYVHPGQLYARHYDPDSGGATIHQFPFSASSERNITLAKRPDNTVVGVYEDGDLSRLTILDPAIGWSSPVTIFSGDNMGQAMMAVTDDGNTIVAVDPVNTSASPQPANRTEMRVIRQDNSVGPSLGGLPNQFRLQGIVAHSFGGEAPINVTAVLNPQYDYPPSNYVASGAIDPIGGSGSFGGFVELDPTGSGIHWGAEMLQSGETTALIWMDGADSCTNVWAATRTGFFGGWSTEALSPTGVETCSPNVTSAPGGRFLVHWPTLISGGGGEGEGGEGGGGEPQTVSALHAADFDTETGWQVSLIEGALVETGFYATVRGVPALASDGSAILTHETTVFPYVQVYERDGASGSWVLDTSIISNDPSVQEPIPYMLPSGEAAITWESSAGGNRHLEAAFKR